MTTICVDRKCKHAMACLDVVVVDETVVEGKLNSRLPTRYVNCLLMLALQNRSTASSHVDVELTWTQSSTELLASH